MAASVMTLVIARAHLRDFLVDSGSLVFADGALDEGLRQAIGDMTRAMGGVKLLLNGLDSAASTTVDVLHEDLLVRGAAGYAAMARSVDRADMASLDGSTAGKLESWGKTQVEWFLAQVELIAVAKVALRAAESAKLTAETALLNAEVSRSADAELKLVAETARLTAMQTPDVNKTTAETANLTADTARITAENALLSARDTAERAKLTAETARLGDAELKLTAETARLTARTTPEVTKLAAESARLTAETAKLTAETLKVLGNVDAAETARRTGLQRGNTSPSVVLPWDEEGEKKW